MVEFAEGDEIALKAGLHSPARAKHGGPRGVEARVGLQAATHVNKPLDTLPEEEEACGDLQHRQNGKESLHAIPA